MESKCFVLLLFSTCLLIPGRAQVVEFASYKLMTTLSIKEYQNLVVVIAAQKVRNGLHRFEMILAVKVNATHTNGESKRGTKF